MKIHYGFDSIQNINNAVVTIGSFDGVHRGHKYLINLMSKAAEKIAGQTVLLTFDPHPREVLHPYLKHRKLSTIDEKLLLLSETTIDHVVVIPFTKEFSQIPPDDFIRKYLLEKLNTKVFFAGEGHFFGKNKEGNAGMLRDFGIKVSNLGRLDNISSTMVRDVIEQQDIKRLCDLIQGGYLIRLPLDDNSTKILPDINEVYSVEYINTNNMEAYKCVNAKLKSLIEDSANHTSEQERIYVKLSMQNTNL